MMKSKLIALSAISASFVAVFLTIGAYFRIVDVFAVVIASVFVTLPLYYKSYKAALLTYLVGGTIAFMISGFNYLSIVFPSYFVFFGIYPIVQNYFLKKKLNAKILGTVFSLLWFVAYAYGIYFFYTGLIGPLSDIPAWISKNIYYFIALFAILFYLVFNRFIFVAEKLINQILQRIIK